MENIQIGAKVSIKRSDGSIQEAEIISINHQDELAKVVFLGSNNTKHSKIVSLAEIKSLNPDIMVEGNVQLPVPQTKNIRRTIGRFENKPTRQTIIIDEKKPRMSLVNTTNVQIDNKENDRKGNNLSSLNNTSYTVLIDHVPRQELPKSHKYFTYNKLISTEEDSLIYEQLKYSEDASCEKKMTVYIRVRPLNSSEKKKQEISTVAVPSTDRIVLFSPQIKFDGVFNENAETESIYKVGCKRLISTFFSGECATCFAYGQTGSGKTFTMHGKSGKSNLQGIYGMVSSDVFETFKKHCYGKKGFSIKCAFFEIYMNKAYDLLDKRKELRVQADGNNRVQIPQLTNHACNSPLDVSQILHQGSLLRSCGKTKSNKESSRSHAVFQFILHQGDNVLSRLSLVDLAGNERGIDAGNVDKVTRNEGISINTSLLALKECIRHMSSGIVDRIPFRNSALTQFLKDSFIGENSKLCMITTISPAIGSCDATLNSLKYAEQVVQINFRDSILPSQLTFRRFDTNGEEEGETFSTSTKDKDMDTEQFSDDRQSEIQSLKLTFQNALTELEEINSLFLTPGGQVTASVKLKLLKYKFNLM
ncbi:Kinesin-like protein KIF2A [Strongyloides ratti]|uniref:Kinesin-like protein n=1 Tax=Strongyloides ratti TaxID=34506 RepID=A0A090LAR8_STRRB|nr:Kinesin-like protein KIF2A [Strongyloides ratti]CEF66852.1 Kinesin-like protein KIF2A [Strongyloides ratti]